MSRLTSTRQQGLNTLISRAGRDPAAHAHVVNTPVYRASSILWPDTGTLDQWRAQSKDPEFRGVLYGRAGNPTTVAFEDAVAELEGGFRGLIMPSGLAAIVGAILSVAGRGGHLIAADNTYVGARNALTRLLPDLGIETDFFNPLDPDSLTGLLRPDTRAIYLESPGSDTFEVLDVPRIAELAHAHGAKVLFDNTWASPYFFRPFEHGVDISIHSATKYLVGHSDAILGMLVTTREHYPTLRQVVRGLGYIAGADDAYLALRGLRTLGVRLERHQRNALDVAEWLAGHPQVAGVRHPAREDHPGHAYWRRDYLGASGLFSFDLPPAPPEAVDAFVNGLSLIGHAASWGGYESLIKLPDPKRHYPGSLRPGHTLIRLHVGLEDTSDLIADLDQALDAYAHVRRRAA